MTVSTVTKGKSTTEAFAKPRKRLSARNKSSHPVSKKTKQQTLFGFVGLETEQSHVKIPSLEHSISSLNESSHALHDQKLQLLATSPMAITQATTTTTALRLSTSGCSLLPTMKGKYDVEYDAVKRQRKFVLTWRNHYPWLQICVEEKYNDGSVCPDFMQCRVCVNNPLVADKRSAFFYWLNEL